MGVRAILWFLFVLGSLTRSFAQEGHIKEEELKIEITPSITVTDVVAAALAISPNRLILQSKSDYATALSNKASSLFSDTPQLSISHQNDAVMSDQGLREWESSIHLPLWMPGQKAANKLKARMTDRENEAFEKIVILDITGQVRELLWELKLAELELDEAKRNLKLAGQLHQLILRGVAAGNIPKKDTIMSSQKVMDQEIVLLSADAKYIDVARRYESLTGLTRAPEFIEEERAASDDPGNFEDDIENYPTLVFAEANADLVRADYEIQKSSWSSAPSLSFGLKRERGSVFDRNINSVNVGISIPLGAGVHTNSKRMEAALAVAEAETAKEFIKKELKLALHDAEHELEICEAQIPIMSEHLSLAEENLRLSQKAYDVGESDLMDLLKIQDEYFISSLSKKRIDLECKRAVARQNQILGVLLP